jgi:hypothetical protein
MINASEALPDSVLQKLRLMSRDAAGIHPVTLYRVCDRRQTLMFLVAASNAEEALEYINELGVDWWLGDTFTNAIQRNVIRKPGVIDACELHRYEHFRDHHKRHARRKRNKNASVAQQVEHDPCKVEVAGSNPAGRSPSP